LGKFEVKKNSGEGGDLGDDKQPGATPQKTAINKSCRGVKKGRKKLNTVTAGKGIYTVEKKSTH